jgi:hypothetical protein
MIFIIFSIGCQWEIAAIQLAGFYKTSDSIEYISAWRCLFNSSRARAAERGFIAGAKRGLVSGTNLFKPRQTLPEGRNVITAPTIALPRPPSSSHKVLLVGAPVKTREMPELAESDALNP